MPKKIYKKRKDGLFQKSFTMNGKRYYVYGHTKKQLKEKEDKLRLKLNNGKINYRKITGSKILGCNYLVKFFSELLFTSGASAEEVIEFSKDFLVENGVNVPDFEVDEKGDTE